MTGVAASLLEQLAELEESGLAAIEGAHSEEVLEEARVAFLGRNGRLAGAMGAISGVEPDQKRAVGQRANAVKKALTAALENRSAALASGR